MRKTVLVNENSWTCWFKHLSLSVRTHQLVCMNTWVPSWNYYIRTLKHVHEHRQACLWEYLSGFIRTHLGLFAFKHLILLVWGNFQGCCLVHLSVVVKTFKLFLRRFEYSGERTGGCLNKHLSLFMRTLGLVYEGIWACSWENDSLLAGKLELFQEKSWACSWEQLGLFVIAFELIHETTQACLWKHASCGSWEHSRLFMKTLLSTKHIVQYTHRVCSTYG